MYHTGDNKPKSKQTADPKKYPQGYFKDKPCRKCCTVFSPKAPSELYCSDECKDIAYQDKYLLRNYGIELSDYLRMLEEQDHKCKICGSEGWVMDPKTHKLKLVVDHCHEHGHVRGLLCHNCNRGLGLFQDSPEVLKKSINYLKENKDG